MSITIGSEYELQKIKFWGSSISGIRTALALPQFGLCFDLGQAYPAIFPMKHFFITHAHQDHAGGLPYLISQKALNHQEPAHIYMPNSFIEPFKSIMKAWETAENHAYDFILHNSSTLEDFPINTHHFVRPFKTSHRIESTGYTLMERNKKLRPEFVGSTQEEILKLKKQNVRIQDEIETPLVSFTGDTKIDFIVENPHLTQSKILIMECTYLDERKTVEHARQWGHTHLDEILPWLEKLENKNIVFIHISSRYSVSEIQNILKKRIPKALQDRVSFFPGR